MKPDNWQIICINTEGAAGRWSRMQERFRHHGLDARRFPACEPPVDGSFVEGLRPGEQACALSHYRIWEYAKSCPQPTFILEDDACFRYNWRSCIASFEPRPWDAIFLNAAEESLPLHTWQKTRGNCMAAAYVLQPHAAEWLVQAFSEKLYAADAMTMALQEQGHCYTYFPWLVIQEGYDSALRDPNPDAAKVRRLLEKHGSDLTMYDEIP